MLDVMIIKNISGRSINRTFKESTQLVSHEESDELSTLRQEILNNGEDNGDKILDINGEESRVYRRERGAMRLPREGSNQR